jgi:hypothetical protein
VGVNKLQNGRCDKKMKAIGGKRSQVHAGKYCWAKKISDHAYSGKVIREWQVD